MAFCVCVCVWLFFLPWCLLLAFGSQKKLVGIGEDKKEDRK
jgi:hypothetical protein